MPLPARAQKRRYWSFQIGRQDAANGDERVFLREREELLAAGLNEAFGRLHRLQCNRWTRGTGQWFVPRGTTGQSIL